MCVCVLYHEYDFNNNNNYGATLGFSVTAELLLETLDEER